MDTCCEGFGKHWIVFSLMQRFAWLPRGRPQGKQKMKAEVRKNGDFLHRSNSMQLYEIDQY